MAGGQDSTLWDSRGIAIYDQEEAQEAGGKGSIHWLKNHDKDSEYPKQK